MAYETIEIGKYNRTEEFEIEILKPFMFKWALEKMLINNPEMLKRIKSRRKNEYVLGLKFLFFKVKFFRFKRKEDMMFYMNLSEHPLFSAFPEIMENENEMEDIVKVTAYLNRGELNGQRRNHRGNFKRV